MVACWTRENQCFTRWHRQCSLSLVQPKLFMHSNHITSQKYWYVYLAAHQLTSRHKRCVCLANKQVCAQPNILPLSIYLFLWQCGMVFLIQACCHAHLKRTRVQAEIYLSSEQLQIPINAKCQNVTVGCHPVNLIGRTGLNQMWAHLMRIATITSDTHYTPTWRA